MCNCKNKINKGIHILVPFLELYNNAQIFVVAQRTICNVSTQLNLLPILKELVLKLPEFLATNYTGADRLFFLLTSPDFKKLYLFIYY